MSQNFNFENFSVVKIKAATNFIAEESQRKTYLEEFQNLSKAETIFKSRKILSLNPLLVANTTAVGGRNLWLAYLKKDWNVIPIHLPILALIVLAHFWHILDQVLLK